MTKNMKMVLSGNKNNQEMSNIIKAANKIAPHETPQNGPLGFCEVRYRAGSQCGPSTAS